MSDIAVRLFGATIFRFSHLHWKPKNKIRLIEGRRRLSQLKKNPGKPGLSSTKMQMSELMKLHPWLKSSTLTVKLWTALLTFSSGSYIM